MSKLISIPISKTKESKTNTKGRCDGDNFADLIASVKEKGILVPLLARELKPAGTYEIIAGNRRFVAAKKAGLNMVPVQLVEMTDAEAMEAQIVENLQREDIHPMDEGEQYRKLIEESKYDTKSIAVKVGKSESYVNNRLFLTNLEPKPAEKYRSGKILDGHAVLIAKLSADDQLKALKESTDGWGNYLTVRDLRKWIKENIYTPLKIQPWLKNEEANKAVGKCVECKPNRASLFGDIKEGECTNVKCWTRKMNLYINWRVKQDKLIKVSGDYNQAKGVISQSDYVLSGGKQKCKYTQKAIIVNSADIGREIEVCINKNCSVHRGMSSQYKLTPKEQEARKEERKKEIEKNKKAKADRKVKIEKALKSIKWPLAKKHLDILYALCFDIAGANAVRSIVKRRELAVKKVKGVYGSSYYDYDGAIKEFVKQGGDNDKIRIAFELLIDTGYDSLREAVNQLIK